MVKIKENYANAQNYGSRRNMSNVKYIVIHYTANDGDSDENNGKYFHNNIVKASAHYFVDDDSITASVPLNYTAYSVGGNKLNTGGGRLYGTVRNANSINIELCDTVRNGVIYPTDKTINNALDLVRKLMADYNIPQSNVIRHFDVTGKKCPAYWVDDAKWKNEFWNKISQTKVEPSADVPFLVQITTDVLNIRAGAGTKYSIVGTVNKGYKYTIVETDGSWGKLKSGVGWISISDKYVKRV